MHIPSNAERLQTISDIVSEGLDSHIIAGGQYYDDKANQIAAQAIQTCMPNLVSIQQSQVAVESRTALSLEGDVVRRYDSAYTVATLSRVSIQQVIESIGEGDEKVMLKRFDLFLSLTPEFIDPSPSTIVFGNELLVPFRDIERFDSLK